MATPIWQAARAGAVGNTSAMDASAQINQLLGTHGMTPVYQGAAVVTPNGTGASYWPLNLGTTDYDQPFTMSGTSIGRVTVPVLPVGVGADLKVSLCADSAGSPGAVITQARIPAAWITQLAGVDGVAAGSTPFVSTTSLPLSVPQFNTIQSGTWTSGTNQSYPSVGSSALFPNTFLSSGNYLITLGGTNSANAVVANVFTIAYQGGTSIGRPQPAPSLPQALFSAAAAATADTLVCMAGTGSVKLATVYTASWDPTTGTIGAWSAQANLPQALDSTPGGGAAWGETVYVVGGQNSSAQNLNTVYYATVSNGQITAWNTGPPLPVALSFTSVAVIGNILLVTGGSLANGAPSSATYYAPINADGSLGVWQLGPTSPVPTSGALVTSPSGIYIIGGFTSPSFTQTNDLQALSIGPTGLGAWQRQTFPVTAPSFDTAIYAAFPTATGQTQIFAMSPTLYYSATLTQVPLISVPLPTPGLSNGATYHILLQQRGGDLNDYLAMDTDTSALPANALRRARGSTGAWTAYSSGQAIPITIYNNALAGGLGSQVWHTWEDNGARTSTPIYDTTPDQRLIGVCEATRFADQINTNASFQSGTTNWTAVNGTLVQSSAQAYIGQYSGFFTPAGGNVLAYIESEQEPVLVGESYTYTAWVYSPGGYSSVILDANWYTASGFLSTTTVVSANVPAAAWTKLTGSTTAPATAVYGTVIVGQASTPSSSNTFYADQISMASTYGGSRLAAVSQITYGGSWPGTAVWPPSGVTQLA